jgi:hypothetical protein
MNDRDSRGSGGLARPFVPTGTTTGPSAPQISGIARPFVPGAPLSQDAAPTATPAHPAPTTGEYYWPTAEPEQQEDSDLAEQAWSDLDWDADTRDRGRSRGEHVAIALEQIAQRIRDGEVMVRGHPGMTHEAAAAAVLAALVAQRR